MSINKMIKIGVCSMLFFIVSSCSIEKNPFSKSLQSTINKFSIQNPEYKVIQIQVSKINNYNLLFITGLNAYDPNMIDGYDIYNGKLITYFQTDSIDRRSLIDVKKMEKYSGEINGYVNVLKEESITEPTQCVFLITHGNKITQFPKGFALLSKRGYIDTNVIRNSKLKNYLYDYIENRPAVLYEVRFKQKAGKQYVIFRPSISYDSLQCNGYFLWNKHLVTLYNIKESGDLLNKKNMVSNHRIPNYRHIPIRKWNFPYPIKIEIQDTKHVKELSLAEGFTL